MGWATVVKMINRLIDGEIICESGIKSASGKGKRAALFGLCDNFPLAIGVDVEYHITKLALTNLSGSILAEMKFETPENLEYEDFHAFLKQAISDFILKYVPNRELLVGIGIGIPGIGVLTSDQTQRQEKSRIMASALGEYFSTHVVVEVNTLAYTVFERWNKDINSNDDFIFVSIRTGVGTGIFLQGKLLVGSSGLVGEIGHVQVRENGRQCRCGKTGCVETETNLYRLYSRYITEVLGHSEPSEADLAAVDRDSIQKGLDQLFSLAYEGDVKASAVVTEYIHYLSYGISLAIMILDIKRVVVSSYFSESVSYISPLLEKEISRLCFNASDISVTYCPFDGTGHTRGAALLILNEYFI